MRALSRLTIVVVILAPTTSLAWDPIKDIERSVRLSARNAERAMRHEVSEAAREVRRVRESGRPEDIQASEERLARARRRSEEQERIVQKQIEERALLALEKELPLHESLPRSIVPETLAIVTDALYSHDFEPRPEPFPSYIFVRTEPRIVAEPSTSSEVILHLVVFWNRAGERLNVRYRTLEKRLRSPEPRVTEDREAREMAQAVVGELLVTLRDGP